MANLFDVYGCRLCEREMVTESGTKKEYVCCDLPMRLVKENTEYEKVDSAELPGQKLTATLDEEIGFTDNALVGKTLIATPALQVKVLGFRPEQETVYEKAAGDMSLFVVSGEGLLALGYEDLEIYKSSVAVVPGGMLWGIKNTGNSPMVVLQTMAVK